MTVTPRIWQERSAGHTFPNDVHLPGVAHSFREVTHEPADTIVAGRPVHFVLETPEPENVDAAAQPVQGGRPVAGKPAYRVPSMAEIGALSWNGYTAASTFSGSGGSSLGYRMAGFRVAYANEFVEAARQTYRANASESTIIDGRDIREVHGDDVLAQIGLGRGELDLLDGSPPCASFSTAGKREKGWGTEKRYSDTVQRSDDLFFEFARLLEEIQPRTFVAENVAGLVKGTAKGYFKLILARLRAAGYVVAARVLDASYLGVPQARKRLIFVGVRNDLATAGGVVPAHPTPLPYQFSVRDALDSLRDRAGGVKTSKGVRPLDGPSPTILTHGNAYTQSELALVLDSATESGPITHDPETGQEIALKRYAIGVEWNKLAPGEKSEKYLNLIRPRAGRPFPTITATGGTVGAAGPTHWAEARKPTLLELRALGGFPHDFILTGTYPQRWERIGRAVPPVMMSAVAATVRDAILNPLREAGLIR